MFNYFKFRGDRSGSVPFNREQRRRGDDKEVLAKRKEVYEKAKQKHPERWNGKIRNWDEIKEVYLNPEKITNKAA